MGGRVNHDGGILHLKVGGVFGEVKFYEGKLSKNFKVLTKIPDGEPKHLLWMLDNYMDYFAETFTRQMQEFDAYYHHGLIDDGWLLVACLVEDSKPGSWWDFFYGPYLRRKIISNYELRLKDACYEKAVLQIGHPRSKQNLPMRMYRDITIDQMKYYKAVPRGHHNLDKDTPIQIAWTNRPETIVKLRGKDQVKGRRIVNFEELLHTSIPN